MWKVCVSGRHLSTNALTRGSSSQNHLSFSLTRWYNPAICKYGTRLYNFTGRGDQDPNLNPTYAEFLKTKCKFLGNRATNVEMDPNSSTKFGSHYYPILLQNKGFFISDATLLTNKDAVNIAKEMVNQKRFFRKFAKPMKNLGGIQVLTGNSGKIRVKCSMLTFDNITLSI
ncbi:peroxidase 30-like [Arachis hypogaea]|uniref:peroxidase 30-like n=1 Tax=Arachis hypogaea TaxID=3818 RepID=UPI000DECDDD6|nr:peroxidase 30-like [Arachis hypogaea]